MGKHSKDKADEDEGTFSGDLSEGELKAQLSNKTSRLEGLAEVSLSPIDTF